MACKEAARALAGATPLSVMAANKPCPAKCNWNSILATGSGLKLRAEADTVRRREPDKLIIS
jgi:hypothetical protein